MMLDPYEFQRLANENQYLLEQVRTLSAELNKQDRTKYLVLRDGAPYIRPPHTTAISRLLIADEVVAQSNLEVLGYSADRLYRQIEALAFKDKREPLDHMWRLTMERDFL